MYIMLTLREYGCLTDSLLCILHGFTGKLFYSAHVLDASSINSVKQQIKWCYLIFCTYFLYIFLWLDLEVDNICLILNIYISLCQKLEALGMPLLVIKWKQWHAYGFRLFVFIVGLQFPLHFDSGKSKENIQLTVQFPVTLWKSLY